MLPLLLTCLIDGITPMWCLAALGIFYAVGYGEAPLFALMGEVRGVVERPLPIPVDPLLLARRCRVPCAFQKSIGAIYLCSASLVLKSLSMMDF